MFSQKKVPFFRKITSKMTNSSKSNGGKRNGPGRNSSKLCSQAYQNGQEKEASFQQKNGSCSFILDGSEKGRNSSCDSQRTTTNEKKNSGLLAAKLKCNEWGSQSQKKNTSAKTVTARLSTLPSGAPTSRTTQIRVNRSLHPSYQPPTAQRYLSMKERREAKEKAKKFRGFQSSLCIIPETDEKGIE